jgi:hypothetical protein
MFDELLERWKLAFGELHLVEECRKRCVAFAYCTEDCFDIEGYTSESFPAGRSLLDEVPAKPVYYYYEYGLGPDGRPLYSCTVGRDGLKQFVGFYRYSADGLEYIVFNLMEGVPYLVQRLVFENGRKVKFQKLVANGGGTYFSGVTGIAAAEKARQNKHSVFLEERYFSYEGEKIVRDETRASAPGIGDYSYVGQYGYDPQGGLVEIRNIYSNGGNRLRYCYWDAEEGIEGLVERAARQMAEMVVEVMLANKVASPIAIVELAYHYADSYLPVISYVSAKEKAEIIESGMQVYEALFLNMGDFLYSDLSSIERPFTQLIQQVNDLDDGHDMARGMQRKVAFLLTKSGLFGRIPVDNNFLAYAIDNSIEGHDADDFRQIMLECGMEESVFNEWDRRRWMRS